MKTTNRISQLGSFLIALAAISSASAATTGQWDFNDGTLRATIGVDLDARDEETLAQTQFGSTTSFGIPNINGEVAMVMRFGKTTTLFGGYGFYAGAPPNGGGYHLNQYTLLMDIYFPSASSGKNRAILQTDTGGNAELFVNPANALGNDGGSFSGNLTPDAWHRIAFTIDTAATPPVIGKFIDGVKVGESTLDGGVDSRWAITGYDAALFSDDNAELEVGYINSLQIRDEKMADAVIAALGGPSATGILTGQPANPYVTDLSPSPETARVPSRSTVSPQPEIRVIIEDGQTALAPDSVRVQIDGGLLATPKVNKADTTTTVTYTPAGYLAPGVHRVLVSFTDDAMPPNSLGVQWQFAVGPYAGLPADAAAPLGSAHTPGFILRSAQAANDVAILNPNTLARAIKQLNGTLTDTGGVLVANASFPGPNPDGSYDVDLVNFHLDASSYALFQDDSFFPGVPGMDGGLDNFATEVVTYLELPAGVHQVGVTVNTDRTDIGTDDGYTIFSGRDARDFQALVVGSFFRGSVPGFSSAFTTNEFSLVAPVDGVYSFRVVFYQTRNDAALEFYTVDQATGDRILVNNTADPRAIKAYRSSTAAFANKPYTAEINPTPGASGLSPTAPIEILLMDGQTQVNTSSIQLSLNGAAVVPTITRVGARTTIFYQPNATRANPTNNFRLVYRDNSSPAAFSFTNDWTFTIAVNTGGENNVTGQWDFEQCDLSATVGKPLQYFDGPSGLTATKTRFGTCTELGVSLINGEDAKIMEVPGDLNRNIGYVMEHLIPPNGGGTKVNQYTLIMDVMVDNVGATAASLLQINSLNNTDDGDLFWQGNQFGQGGSGYNGTGAFTPSAWHRICAAYDEAANPPVVTKYVDGIKQDDWTANQGLDNPRRALLPTAILFADGDQDERRRMWVNSIQIRAGKMSDAEMAALAGPSAAGIPQIAPETRVTGQWDFEFNNGAMNGFLAPSVGKPLQYLDGPTGVSASGTQFGTCTALGVPLINGEDANIMRVPGELDRNIGYIMQHLIPPNGGGTKVNQYTLIMDLLVDTSGPGYASLLQTSSLNNTDDGDLFWGENDFGQGGEGYRGADMFTPGVWHRICAAYDMAANPPVVTKYVDGIKQDDWTANQGLDLPRRALQPTAILFADGDQDERRAMWVNSIQIRAGKLSDAEMAALGGPSARGIPVVIPRNSVTGQWDFNVNNSALNGFLAPTVGKALQYFDGPSGLTASGTQFGTCSSFGVPLINGEDALVMRVPGDLNRNIGYIMEHLIPPNGGGTKVNQYTLIMDLMVDNIGASAASLLQINSLNNTDDGDLFWQDNNFGQGGGGYNGTSAFTPLEWHRICAAYNEAGNPPVVTKYVDGIFQDDWTANQGLDHPRRALLPTAILFADGDQDERRVIWVNSIQIRSAPLSKAEMAALSGPSASGIPIAISLPPPPPEARLSLSRSGNTLVISWPPGVTGYILESTPSLANPDWQPVGGVAGNCANVALTPGTRFFRLTGP
jgi:hypothetical protein